jgi:hypothetical protein
VPHSIKVWTNRLIIEEVYSINPSVGGEEGVRRRKRGRWKGREKRSKKIKTLRW